MDRGLREPSAITNSSANKVAAGHRVRPFLPVSGKANSSLHFTRPSTRLVLNVFTTFTEGKISSM